MDRDRRAILVWDFEQGATGPRIEAEQVIWQPDPNVAALNLAVPPLVRGAVKATDEDSRPTEPPLSLATTQLCLG